MPLRYVNFGVSSGASLYKDAETAKEEVRDKATVLQGETPEEDRPRRGLRRVNFELEGGNEQVLAPPAPIEEPAPPAEEQGDFMRGLQSATVEQPKMAYYGIKGLAANTVGNLLGKKDWGAEDFAKFLELKDQEALKSKPSDIPTNYWTGKAGGPGDVADFFQHWTGYMIGEAGKALTAAGAGAMAGGVVGAAGGAGASVAYSVMPTVAKKAISNWVERKVAEKVAVKAAEGAAVDKAKQEIVSEMAKTIGKYTTIGNLGALNVFQQTGMIYNEARDEAGGRGLENSELARVASMGVATAAVESLADMLNLGAVFRTGEKAAKVGAKALPGHLMRNMAIEGFKAGAREGVTEFIQGVGERYGAGKDLTSAEAIDDYINNFIIGAFGGGLLSVPAGVARTAQERGQSPTDLVGGAVDKSKDVAGKIYDAAADKLNLAKKPGEQADTAETIPGTLQKSTESTTSVVEPTTSVVQPTAEPITEAETKGQEEAPFAKVMSPEEYVSLAKTEDGVNFAAAVFSNTQNDKLKTSIIEWAQATNAYEDFKAAIDDQKAIDAGMALIRKAPEEQDRFVAGLPEFVSAPPTTGVVTTKEGAAREREKAVKEQVETEINDPGYLASQEAELAAVQQQKAEKSQATEPVDPQEDFLQTMESWGVPYEPTEEEKRSVKARESRKFLAQKTAEKYQLAPAEPKSQVARIAAALGYNVFLFDDPHAKETGKMWAGFSGSGKKNIFLNRKLKSVGRVTILGHEIFHEIEAADPDTAAKLRDLVKKYVQENEAKIYREQFSGRPESEVTADVMGRLFVKEEFWEYVLNSGPEGKSIYDKVIVIVRQVINKLNELIKNRPNLEKDLPRLAIADAIVARDTANEIAKAMAAALVSVSKKPGGAQATAQPSEQGGLPKNVTDGLTSASRILDATRRERAIESQIRIYAARGVNADAMRAFVAQQSAPVAAPAREAKEPSIKRGTYVPKRDEAKARTEAQLLKNAKERDEAVIGRVDRVLGAYERTEQRKKPKKSRAKEQKDASRAAVNRARVSEPARPRPAPEPRLETDRRSPIFNKFRANLMRIASGITTLGDEFDAAHAYVNEQEAELSRPRRFKKQRSEVEYVFKLFEGGASFGPSWYQKVKANLRQTVSNLDAARAQALIDNTEAILSEMEQEAQKAINAGVPQDLVRNEIAPYLRAVEALSEPEPNVAAAADVDPYIGPDSALTEDDQMRNARNIADGLISGEIDRHMFMFHLVDGNYKGDFTKAQLEIALKERGVDVPLETIPLGSRPFETHSLERWVKDHGNNIQTRLTWLESLHNYMQDKTVPDDLKSLTLLRFSRKTQREYKRYSRFASGWKRRIERYSKARGRRGYIDNSYNIPTSIGANRYLMLRHMSVDRAFPLALYNSFSLSMMRDPSLIPDPMERLYVQNMKNAEEQWFMDVWNTLIVRPDLKHSLLETVSDSDGAEIMGRWKMFENNFNRAALNAEMFPYYEALYREVSPSDVRAESMGWHTLFSKFADRLRDAQVSERLAVIDAAGRAAQFFDALPSDADINQYVEMFIDGMTADDVIRSLGYEHIAHDRAAFEISEEEQAQADRERNERIQKLQDRISQMSPEERESATEAAIGEAEIGNQMDTEGGDYVVDPDSGEIIDRVTSDPKYDGPNPDDIIDQSSRPLYRRVRKGNASGYKLAVEAIAEIERLFHGWKARIPYEVVANPNDLPVDVRDRIMENLDADTDPKGVLVDGKLYFFYDYLTGPDDLQFTVFHEVLGHYGLRALLGPDFDAWLQRMHDLNPQIRSLADRISKEEKIGILEATEEAVSDLAALGAEQNLGVFKSMMAKVVIWLRSKGWDSVADWIDSTGQIELAHVLNGARQAVRNGTTLFSGMPDHVRFNKAKVYEMYSRKNGKITGYARYNQRADKWIAWISTAGEDIKTQREFFSALDDKSQVAHLFKKYNPDAKTESRYRSAFYREAKGPSTTVNIDTMPTTRWQRIKRDLAWALQNQYYPVYEVVKFLERQGRETSDLWGHLIRYDGRLGHLLERFQKKYVDPITKLVEEIGKKGGTMQDVDDFLLARHAPERNLAISKISPNNQTGSGISNAQAQEILDRLNATEYAGELREIAKMIDRLGRMKPAYLYKTGLVREEQFSAVKGYKHYVNLSGREGSEDLGEDMLHREIGRKLNLRGLDLKRALGRWDKPNHTLARTLISFESALIRGQKNLIAQQVLNMVEANPDPNFALVNPQVLKQHLGDDGYVHLQEDDSHISGENVFVAKVNGRTYKVDFRGRSGLDFVKSIHGQQVTEPSIFMNALGKIHLFMGKMITTYNPAWAIINYARDLQTAFFNMGLSKGLDFRDARAMMRYVPKITSSMYMIEFNKGNVDPFIRKKYEEFLRLGGATYFLDRHSVDERVADFLEAIQQQDEKAVHKVVRNTKLFFEMMERITLPVENVPRLASYMYLSTPVEQGGKGWSKEDAAAFAKDLTVNFNMKGAKRDVRQFYLFFNPALQGSERLLRPFRSEDPEVRKRAYKVLAAYIFVGAAANIIARSLGSDDDDELDKLPLYKRYTSMVLNPNGFGAIPLAYGYNAFYAMGHFAYDAAAGYQPISRSVGRIAQATLEAFVPQTGNVNLTGITEGKLIESVAKTVVPTAVVPLVELMQNQNRYGGPIQKEGGPYTDVQTARAHSYFNSVSPLSRNVMTWLNDATGGNRYENGVIGVNPGVIDHLINGYLPGLGSEAYRSLTAVAKAVEGRSLPDDRTRWPIAERLSAHAPESFPLGAFKRVAQEVETKYKVLQDYPERRADILKEHPGLPGMKAQIAAVKNQIRDGREMLNKIETSRSVPEEQKISARRQILTREREIFTRFMESAQKAGFREEVLGVE